jgi:FKBP-type peptidyl-prolyl cis-trans isomerase
MQKQIIKVLALSMGAAMFMGIAMAQQTPASHSQSAPPTNAPTASTAKTQPVPAAKSPSVSVLKTQRDKTSYAIGMNIGKNLHKDSVDVDPNLLLRGLKDALAGSKPLLTDDEARAAMIALQTDVRQRQQVKMQQAAETNKKAGEAFLASNKAKPGVVTLPSGLQYKVLKEGSGPKPSASDSVVCNYRGTLLDNTEFDSSYKRGQPATFQVGQVIKGWTEALQLMPAGSKWQLFVPSELAYGQRGAGPDIGPNATLIFEVELLSIEGKGK